MTGLLEDRIRLLAKRGEITHITLAPTGKNQWQASYRDSTSVGYRIQIADDPVSALMECLNSKAIEPKRSRRDLVG